MKNKLILGSLLGAAVLGAGAYAAYEGYQHRDEIKDGAKKAGNKVKGSAVKAGDKVKVSAVKAQDAVKDKTDKVSEAVKDRTGVIVKKIESDTDLVEFLKETEKFLKSKGVLEDKVTESDLEDLQKHFASFVLEPETSTAPDLDNEGFEGYTVSEEEYPTSIIDPETEVVDIEDIDVEEVLAEEDLPILEEDEENVIPAT